MSRLWSPLMTPRVVLVENDEILAGVIRYNLEVLGATVACFYDGRTALQGLVSDPPDLVILNWGLPRLSGIEVLRQIRAYPPTRQVPIIMLTSRTEPRDRRRAMSAGAHAFVGKPFSINTLMETIAVTLESRVTDRLAATGATGVD